MDKKSVSLVLGSGGAKGLAHIGVIRWLEENNLQIASVSGSSIGALIGGIYAAGKLDEFEQWVRAIKKADMVNLLDIAWDRSGLIKGDKIITTLVELVGEQHIEELPIPFTAVATDIMGEREVWLSRGRLFDAIRASISLPMFFTPFELHGTTLIDGGVLNPVPIAPTFRDRTDITIAVNLGGAIRNPVAINDVMPAIEQQNVALKKPESPALHEKITQFFKGLQKNSAAAPKRDWSAYDVANQAFDAMQSTIARQKLAAYPPDLEVEIARNACGTLEFNRAAEMISLGYLAADKSLRSLRLEDSQAIVIPGGHEIY